jgi:hypothetical protein
LATFFFLAGIMFTSFVSVEFDRLVGKASQVRSVYFFFLATFLAAFFAGFLHGMDCSPPHGRTGLKPSFYTIIVLRWYKYTTYCVFVKKNLHFIFIYFYCWQSACLVLVNEVIHTTTGSGG